MSGVLTLASASAGIVAAFEHAKSLGVAVTVAVVDRGGNLMALQRDERANLVSLDLAGGKAYTALAMNLPTREVHRLVQPGETLYHLDLATKERPLVVFAGGLPFGDPVMGAIGVSGGSPDQDDQIAAAGLRAIQE